MARLPPYRHARDLALDFVFIIWVSYVLVTGHFFPKEALYLLRSDSPSVVVTEPVHENGPKQLIETVSLEPEA